MKGGVPNIKYYALKQFAHFVRPGAQRVNVNYGSAGDQVRIAAFKDPNTGATTFVLSNNGTTDINVSLSLKNATIPAVFQQYRTSATENCLRIADIAGAANTLVNLPAGSIVTLYAGPDLVTPQLTTASAKVTPTQWADAWNTNALRQAAFKGDYDTVKSLIASGADVNTAFGNGWTPLFTAAASPYNKADLIIKALLNAGANFNQKDVEGLTALHVAAMNQIPAYGTVDSIAAERIKALINAGADVNARDAYGRTPLMYAAMMPKLGGDFGQADTSSIEALLAAGADQTLLDNSGRSARDWAIAESAPEAVALLSPPGSIEAHVFKDNNGNGARRRRNRPGQRHRLHRPQQQRPLRPRRADRPHQQRRRGGVHGPAHRHVQPACRRPRRHLHARRSGRHGNGHQQRRGERAAALRAARRPRAHGHRHAQRLRRE
ncbi:MAG: ankyrin repeat domain-containing protein [Tepidisphaeraceae bacterium]